VTFWTPDNLKIATGGSWLARGDPRAGAPALAGLSTDSRAVRRNQVFLALRGDRFDGHAFVTDAVRAGAGMVIVDDPAAFKPDRLDRPVPAICVADTAKALLKLASVYRRQLDTTRVIAVAGSNGKTTTTSLVASVLSSRLRGTAPRGSFNNAIGVPLTILSASTADQFLLCEVGTNAPGEIAALAEVIEPDVAVLTSIGREHLEGLGSIEGVAREEGSLLAYLRPGGLAVVTGDTPLLGEFLAPVPHLVTFGRSPSADLRLTEFVHEAPTPGGIPSGSKFSVNDRWTYRTRLLGEHNALNALAAIAVGRRLGVTDDEIARALAEAKAPPMRLERSTIGPVEVLNDAYNANPDSMAAALRAFLELGAPARRRVAVLGDMLELGLHAADAHRQVGRLLRSNPGVDAVVLVGHLMLHAAEALHDPGTAGGPGKPWADERVLCVSDLDDAQAAAAARFVRPGDFVLLKGSRGRRLERMFPALRARFDPTGPAPAHGHAH
jgi:UDP-N-acetylmuramoyl-tripeptide--D-alanyl-D-alanine ligase